MLAHQVETKKTNKQIKMNLLQVNKKLPCFYFFDFLLMEVEASSDFFNFRL
jgi:hypothetical protein